MKTKTLFILLLFIPVFFTSCEEDDCDEVCACNELGGSWMIPSDELPDGEFRCVF